MCLAGQKARSQQEKHITVFFMQP